MDHSFDGADSIMADDIDNRPLYMGFYDLQIEIDRAAHQLKFLKRIKEYAESELLVDFLQETFENYINQNPEYAGAKLAINRVIFGDFNYNGLFKIDVTLSEHSDLELNQVFGSIDIIEELQDIIDESPNMYEAFVEAYDEQIVIVVAEI